MEYLQTQLKDGTTYQEYLEESVEYRNHLYEGFSQEILSTPMDEDQLLQLAKQFVVELLPDKSLFINEEDYNEVFNETLVELSPIKVKVSYYE